MDRTEVDDTAGARPDDEREPPPAPAPRASGQMTRADYEEAMSPRGVHARARGLSAPYIPGGRDPDPDEGRRQERFYLRLLVLMVAVIVLGGFIISIVGLILTGGE